MLLDMSRRSSGYELGREISVSRRCPICEGPGGLRMQRKAFIRACLKIQKIRVQGAGSGIGNFNDDVFCRKCITGKQIRERKPFKRPHGVTFVSLGKMKKKRG
jgi:hypothetical protein